MMEDTLRNLTYKTIHQYCNNVLSFCPDKVVVKSNDDVEYGIGLIEEIVRGARDWENVGNRKLEIIKQHERYARWLNNRAAINCQLELL